MFIKGDGDRSGAARVDRAPQIFVHYADNVNFPANNVNRSGLQNRSRKAY